MTSEYDRPITEAKAAALIAALTTHAANHAPGGSDDTYSGWGHRHAGLIEPFPAWATAGNAGMTSGTLYLQYFRPDRALTIGRLGYSARGTASSGITLGRLGLYTVNGSGDVTLVAATASDTAMGNSANAPYDAALSTGGGLPATYGLTRGTQYAIGILLVGTTPGNASVGGQGMSGTVGGAWKGRDALARTAAGQTDLPTSLATGALSNAAQWLYTYATA